MKHFNNKKVPVFKRGDKYVHFTKYGGVNHGEVQDVRDTYGHVILNGERMVYISWSIVSSNGIILELDGSDGKIYKLSET